MEGFWLISYLALWTLSLMLTMAVFLALRQLGLAYAGTSAGVARDGLQVGSEAPDFSGTGELGALERFSAVAGWRVLVFGRPVCPPCQALVPGLNALASSVGSRLTLLFLSQGDQEATEIFRSETGITVPVWGIDANEVGDRYKVRVSPFCFVVDPDGVIRSKGPANAREHLEALLDRAQAPFRSDTLPVFLPPASGPSNERALP